MFAEALSVKLNQSPAMAGFLGAHAVEYGCSGWEFLPKAFGEIGIDSLVVFLERNRQSQDFLLVQLVEIFHLRASLRRVPRGARCSAEAVPMETVLPVSEKSQRLAPHRRREGLPDATGES